MSRCDGCGGEDCACCEVFIEEQLDQRYEREQMFDDEFDPIRYDDDEEDE